MNCIEKPEQAPRSSIEILQMASAVVSWRAHVHTEHLGKPKLTRVTGTSRTGQPRPASSQDVSTLHYVVTCKLGSSPGRRWAGCSKRPRLSSCLKCTESPKHWWGASERRHGTVSREIHSSQVKEVRRKRASLTESSRVCTRVWRAVIAACINTRGRISHRHTSDHTKER